MRSDTLRSVSELSWRDARVSDACGVLVRIDPSSPMSNCNTIDSVCVYPRTSIVAQALLSLVILTTIQAQDFKDVAGDGLIGRRTLPLAYPRGSRVLMAVLLPAWSLLLSYMYAEAGAMLIACTILLGTATGVRFLFESSRKRDEESYMFYNVSDDCQSGTCHLRHRSSHCYQLWLLALHVIPFVKGSSISASAILLGLRSDNIHNAVLF